jgi:uncharacterized damage-inducible protein DinB
MNANLIDIVGLVPEGKLDWTPAPTEWSIRLILVHIIMARYFGPLAESAPPDFGPRVIEAAKTRRGIQDELAASWANLEGLLLDEERLTATYEVIDPGRLHYRDPEVMDGHYIAYHRFAHDLHHRSTLLGHMRQVGVKISDHLIRPLD